jgi:uncharacterized protein
MRPRPGPRRVDRRGVPVFLAISFALAWLPFLPVLFGGAPVGAMLMPFAPAIACVVVRRWVTREGFGDAGLRLSIRGRWPLLVVALFWPLAATMTGVALGVASSSGPALALHD